MIGFVNIILFTVFAASISAADYDLDFAEEPTYRLIKEVVKNDEVIGWTFEIYINIQNNGNEISRETAVNITDEEGFTLEKTTSVQPGEIETVTFTWSTLSSYDQLISVSFFPVDLDINKNEYNSGSIKFKLIIDKEDGVNVISTPGFEIFFLLFAISIIFILKKKQ
jgi:hypothetical protein